MTAQQQDRVWIDDSAWVFRGTPLDLLLRDLADQPRFATPHAALYRGYLASWRIEDGWLLLDDVEGWFDEDGSIVMKRGNDALTGITVPCRATWVSGEIGLGAGNVMPPVAAGQRTWYEREATLVIEGGRVLDIEEVVSSGPMGSAGPYLMVEPLFGEMLSGGAFGQVIAAADRAGVPLVAKVPRPGPTGEGGTELWFDTPDGRRPGHVPAFALREAPEGALHVEALDAATTVDVLRREAALLEADEGLLLPRSFGLWTHEPSGAPVLVMERLRGRPPQEPEEVCAVLEALAAAATRNSLDHHGDIKVEHVFIDHDGSVRLCDPAPRLTEPNRRAFTPIWNPQAHCGPAADVAGCATILRYLPGGGARGWRWSAAMLDEPVPPAWGHDHAAALDILRAELAQPLPPPPGWVPPAMPESRAALARLGRRGT